MTDLGGRRGGGGGGVIYIVGRDLYWQVFISRLKSLGLKGGFSFKEFVQPNNLFQPPE